MSTTTNLSATHTGYSWVIINEDGDVLCEDEGGMHFRNYSAAFGYDAIQFDREYKANLFIRGIKFGIRQLGQSSD